MDSVTINKMIVDYLKLPDPSVSLMISGPWGAGKTHYLVSQKRTIEQASGKRLAFVSVAGLSTRAELDQALFAAYAPWLFKGQTQAAAPLLKAAVRFIKLEPKDFTFAADFSADKDAVVLDDVDRFHGDIRVLIGFIVDLVDQSRLHTLLIASEKNIRQAKEFAELKEKIVGVTVHIQADVDARLDEFINAVISIPVRACLQAHRSDLSSAAASWGVGNLRSLKHAVARLAALLGELGGLDEIGEHRRLLVGGVFIGLLEIARDESQTEAVADIFSTAAVGAAASADYLGLHRIDEGALLVPTAPGQAAVDESSREDAQSEPELRKRWIVQAYPLFELASFPGSPAFARYFKHGAIDAAAMIEPFLELRRHHSPRELLLRDYRQLQQSEFDHEAAALLEDLRAGKVDTLPKISMAYLTLRHFALAGMIEASLADVAHAALLAVEAIDETRISQADADFKYWPVDLYEPADKSVLRALQDKQGAVQDWISESDRLAMLDPRQTAQALARRLQSWGDGELFVGNADSYLLRILEFSPQQLHALAQFLQNRLQQLSKNIRLDWWSEPELIEKIAALLEAEAAQGQGKMSVLQAERIRLAKVMQIYVAKVRGAFEPEREKYRAALDRRAELEAALPPAQP